MIYQWTVTAEEVAALYPRARALQITETSEGVSLPLLRTWIAEASAHLNGALEARGYSDLALQLHENAQVIGASAVRAYAISRGLLSVGRTDEAALHRQSFDTALDTFKRFPEYLGGSQPTSAQVSTNIDLLRPSPNGWGRNFQGW